MAGLRKFKLALIQLAVGASKPANLERAGSLVREAASNGAKLIALPECFNSPYGVSHFPAYAEPVPEGESTKLLSALAKECQVYLVGGSVPERDKECLYNTCTVFGPEGNLLGKYRKMHLFDIDIPGGIRFKESEVLSPGNNFLTFDTEWCKVGVGICYDIRFQELASIYNQKGCELLLYPGAFNTVTGPVHWELLARGRAVDNQCYVASVSPARDEGAGYVAWGHTCLVNPWGKVVASTEEKEAIIYEEVDLDYVAEVRRNVPISMQRRPEVYTCAHPTT